MCFNFKSYKFINFKKKLKNKSIIYICNTKTKSNFIKEMQYNKSLNFNFYKLNNSLIKKCLEKSIFLNYSNLFSSSTVIAELKSLNDLKKNLKKLNENNIIISLNINNKIYVNEKKINKLILLNFKKDQKNFLNILKISLKKLKKFRNNVI